MAEYIDRQEVIKKLEELDTRLMQGHYYDECEGVAMAKAIVNGVPAADVKMVVRGRWVYHNFDTICSKCRKSAIFDEWEQQAETEFCPHCGAKMDGEG